MPQRFPSSKITLTGYLKNPFQITAWGDEETALVDAVLNLVRMELDPSGAIGAQERT